MGFGAGNSALDLGKVPTSIVSAPLSSSSLPKPSRGASTSLKAEPQMEPIHHPYSGGQLCLLPVPPFRVGFRGRCAPGSGALAVRSPPGRRRCSIQTPTVGSRRPPRCHRLGAACHACSHSVRVLVTAGSVSRGGTSGPWRWLRRKRACSWKCGDGCRARS